MLAEVVATSFRIGGLITFRAVRPKIIHVLAEIHRCNQRFKIVRTASAPGDLRPADQWTAAKSHTKQHPVYFFLFF